MLLVAVVSAYAIGSIPTALLLGRRHGVDPRRVGDGNVGWWNARAALGKRAAVPVLLIDVAKGALAAGLGMLLTDAWWQVYLVGGAAMVGHAFPVFARFRGGRSVLTFCGVVAVICPLAVALSLLGGALTGFVRKSAPFGYRSAMVFFPFVQALLQPLTHVAATGVLMTFIGWRFLRARRPDPATNAPV